jgi:hypothetical protein
MRRIRHLVIAFVCMVSVSGLTAGVVSASDEGSGDARAIVEAVRRVAPPGPEAGRIPALKRQDGTYEATAGSTLISIPGRADGQLVLTSTTPARSFGISLPRSQSASDAELVSDGTVVFLRADRSSGTALQSFADGVRILTVVASS